jgi:arylsulfatase A-like enzyme
VVEPAEVSQQVCLVDITPTVLSVIHLQAFERTEGANLLELSGGQREASMACSLMGRTPELGGGRLFGLRTSVAKFMLHPESGDEWLYDLVDDPEETTNVATEQPEASVKGRMMAEREYQSWANKAHRLEPTENERLKALGYVD